MISFLVTTLLPLALRFVGFAVEKYIDDKQSKRKFVEFVEAIGNHSGVSVELRDSYKSNLEKLENDWRNDNTTS